MKTGAPGRGVAVARLVLAGALATAGCRLVDQTSFGNAPRPPAADALTAALASPGGSPLLVIHPDDGVPYQEVLRAAVDAAEARGNARFRLEAVAPVAGSLDDQQTALNRAAAEARAVLDEMGADGVQPDRVALTARSDPRIDHAELRLYQG